MDRMSTRCIESGARIIELLLDTTTGSEMPVTLAEAFWATCPLNLKEALKNACLKQGAVQNGLQTMI